MASKVCSLFVLLMLSVAISAQIKDSANKKVTEKVSFIVNMHCSSCQEKIEKYIPLEKGVKDLKVDLEKKEVAITYKPAKTTVEKLKRAIEELGYNCSVKTF